MKFLQFALGSMLWIALFATASVAQNGRTFVSGAGADTNPCSLASPCRTFAQAISVTNSGGEVVALTSAGYGPFTISKAVTVEAPAGVYAGITVTSGSGIVISAGPNDTVILRGLTINNQSAGITGILFSGGNTLHVESCVVNGFNGSGEGIAIGAPGNVFVEDTIARANGTGIVVGSASAGAVNVAMEPRSFGW
jgi:hypothetical protein